MKLLSVNGLYSSRKLTSFLNTRLYSAVPAFVILLCVSFLGFLVYSVGTFSFQAEAAPVTTTWEAEYFEGMELSGTPVLTRSEAAIDHDWEQGSPDPLVPTDEFSARWTGTIDVDAGPYSITARADDGIRVYVDGNLVIDGWVVQLATTYTEDIVLTAGTHTVVVEYFDRWWVASAQVSIETAPYTVGVGTNEPGTKIVVDGIAHDVPYDLGAQSGETYTIHAPTTQTTPDGRTVQFVSWSDGGAQTHDVTPGVGESYIATYEEVDGTTATIFANGFEEGDTSAYPQPNIDVAEGNSLEVTSNNVRTGDYSLEVSTGGTAMPSVIDQLFPKRSTVYQRTFISLPSDYSLESGAAENIIVLKTDDFRNLLWVTIGPDYRLSPIYFNDAGEATYPGGFGPEIPRDGSWHEIQIRHTVDLEHGWVELWLDGEKIADISEVNTGLPDRDDIHVVTWGSYFSTVTNTNTVFFDDVEISDVFITDNSEGFQTENIVSGLNIPTYAAFAPDGRIFIAEKDGTIRVFKDGALLPDPLVVIPNVNTFNDRGLLSLAVDPNFETNGYLYAAYTHDVDPSDFEGPKTARVVRYTVTGDVADLGSEFVVLGTEVGDAANPSCDDFPMGTDCMPSDARTHTVGNLHFLPDGSMLVSAGEGAPDTTVNTQALRSQNLDSLGGKILRVNPATGEGYSDNPFYTGDPGDNRSKVWAYGFRNPFRFGVKPGTNTIYTGDVGWGTWEEIDVVTPGANYGWPCYEGDEYLVGYSVYQTCQDLEAAGTATPPIHVYPHPPSSAVVGGTFYEGVSYPAQYQGAFFFGDYAQSTIWTMQTDENDEIVGEVEEFPELPGGPVQIFSGPDGDIYYLSIFNGQLRRISYLTNGLPPQAVVTATPEFGAIPLEVVFSSEGTTDPDGEVGSLVYEWDFGDGNTSTEANPTHTYADAGVYDAVLTVRDVQGHEAVETLRIYAGNTAPEITIDTPVEGFQYDVGDTVTFSASATDIEDGDLTSSMGWTVLLHHCASDGSCHDHPFLDGTGAGGSFTAPDHGDGTSLEIYYTATDSQGLETTTSRLIEPNLVTMTFETEPVGLTIVVNGDTQIAPFTKDVQVNGTNSLFTPSPQTLSDGSVYEFVSWSDGGARSHDFVATTSSTFTATFEDVAPSEEYVFHSYDSTFAEGDPQGGVSDSSGTITANLDVYISDGVDSLTQDAELDAFADVHPEGFNNLDGYWSGASSDYPYVGKSASGRGSDSVEGSVPLPLGVSDIQMHPAQSESLTVLRFTAPVDANYSISGLSARRVLSWGSTSSMRVFGDSFIEVASVTADSQDWNTDTTTYDLGALSAGDSIYIAVDRDGDFVGDATEIAWSITATQSVTQPPVVNAFTATPTNLYTQSTASATLEWITTNADTVSIDNGVGDVAVDGSFEVTPGITTPYELTATGPGGVTTESVIVTVIDDLPPTVEIGSPVGGSTVTGSDVEITYTLTGDLQTGDHLHLTLDDNPHVTITDLSGSYTFTDVSAGPHTITAEVARPSHIVYEYPESRDSETFTVESGGTGDISRVWNSWDASMSDSDPEITVTDGTSSAVIRFYEHALSGIGDVGRMFDTFSTSHPEGFNNVSSLWTMSTGDFGSYPYVGLSSVGRGEGGSESGAPSPTGVSDLQFHPGETDLSLIASFEVPEDGTYRVENLAIRRVLSWGGTSRMRVYTDDGTEVASLTAGSQTWTVDGGAYELGSMTAGDKIYFAIDRDGDFVGDATEVAWTVLLNP